MKPTILDTVENDLCTGCGTCTALCPKDAITIITDEKKGIYVPQLNEDTCSRCGLCYDVCPGHDIDFKDLNLEIFGKSPKDILIGNHLSFYLGNAIDYDIRYNSASGGLITAILISALEEGLIDGALVTRMNKNRPLESEPFIAKTVEEIIDARGSKYCPASTNVALRHIIDAEEGKKFAFVGLPCHIHGLRKAERKNKKLKEKIAFRLGIFCGGTHNLFATQTLLQKLRIKKDEIMAISYRGNGFPGKISIKFKDGETILIPFVHFFNILFGPRFFRPMRCNFCPDGVAELADISFGDAWLHKCKKTERLGRSILIVRNKIGEKLISEILNRKKIDIQNLNYSELMQSTQSMLNSKKRIVKIHMFFAAVFQNKKIPNINTEFLRPNIFGAPFELLSYLNTYVGLNKTARKFLIRLPTPILKIYNLTIAGIFRYL